MSFSLERLVHAIASSVIQAQNLVEKAQLGNLRSYFDKDSKPISVDIKLPSMHPPADEPDATDIYKVPVVTLVPHGSLMIKRAKIEMDVRIGDLTQDDKPVIGGYPDIEALLNFQAHKDPILPKLVIEAAPGGKARKGESNNFAHVTLSLSAAETTEGMARLLNEILKAQGRVIPPQPDTTGTTGGNAQ